MVWFLQHYFVYILLYTFRLELKDKLLIPNYCLNNKQFSTIHELKKMPFINIVSLVNQLSQNVAVYIINNKINIKQENNDTKAQEDKFLTIMITYLVIPFTIKN